MKDHFYESVGEDASRIAYLIAGFVKDSLTEAQAQELDDWVNLDDDHLFLFEQVTDPKYLKDNIKWLESVDTESSLAKAKLRIAATEGEPIADGKRNRSVVMRMLPYAAAVVIIFVAGMLAKQYYTKNDQPTVAVVQTDLSPGQFKAQLKLASGTLVSLSDDSGSSKIASGIEVNRVEGRLLYSGEETGAGSGMNTLTVPRGGMYRLTLGDGTNVWVNAGSSIEYPVQFGNNERRVTLLGEAYFEVAKDAQRPFIVSTGGSNITVLGTRFNVNGYGDLHPVITTVTEGRVALEQADYKVILNAQEAGMVLPNGKLEKAQVEADEAVAWKDGKFVLKDATITEVMQQIERWYDATIVYENNPDDHFNLEIKRDEKLNRVLELLEMTGRVKFEVKGRVITVRK